MLALSLLYTRTFFCFFWFPPNFFLYSNFPLLLNMARKNSDKKGKVARKAKAHKTPAVPAVPALVQADSPPSSPRYAPSMQTPRASAEFVAGLADMVQVLREEIQILIPRVTELTSRVARLEQARPPEQLRGGILQRQ
jgi:hypothetical protein